MRSLWFVPLAFASLSAVGSARAERPMGGARILLSQPLLADNISAIYRMEDAGKVLRDLLPTLVGPDDFENDTDYYMNAALYGSVGLCMIVFILLSWLFFCTCCCNDWPNAYGYSKKDRRKPCVRGFLLSLFMAVLAAVALYFVNDISQALVRKSDSVVASGVNSIDRFQTQIDDVEQSLNVLVDETEATADNMTASLNDLTDYEPAVSAISDQISLLTSWMDDLEVTTDTGYYGFESPMTFTCQYCVDVDTLLNSADSEITAQIGDTTDLIDEAINDIQSGLIDIESEIVDSIREVNSSMNSDVDGYLGDKQDTANDVQDTAEEYETYWFWGSVGLLSVPVLGMLFYIYAYCRQRECSLRLLYVIWFVWSMLMFLLFAIYTPIAIVGGGICERLNIEERDIAFHVGGSAGDIIEGCLLSVSPIDSLNESTAIAPRDKVVFPTFPLLDATFTFAELDDFRDAVANLTVATFDWNYTVIPSRLNGINNITMDSAYGIALAFYDENNVTLLDPEEYPPDQNDTLTKSKGVVITYRDARTILENYLDSMNVNVSKVYEKISNASNVTAVAEEEINTLGVYMDPLFNQIDASVNSVDCAWVGQLYKTVKSSLCEDVVGGLTFMCIAILILGYLGLVSVCCTVKYKRRIRRPLNTLTPYSMPGAGADLARQSEEAVEIGFDDNEPTGVHHEENSYFGDSIGGAQIAGHSRNRSVGSSHHRSHSRSSNGVVMPKQVRSPGPPRPRTAWN